MSPAPYISCAIFLILSSRGRSRAYKNLNKRIQAFSSARYVSALKILLPTLRKARPSLPSKLQIFITKMIQAYVRASI